MMSFFSSLHRNFAHPLILLFLTLILVPALFLPFGIDQCTFIRGSELLFSGGKLYADYFDQKPPLLFVLYGLGGVLFGKSDIGYRFFDFLWQLFTVFSLLYCAQRLTHNKRIGILAASAYAILYCSMGHSEIMECESFIAPALVWLIYLTCKENSGSITILLLRGALVGFCFGLKFTFGLILPVIFLWELLENRKGLTGRIVFITIGFLISATGSLWIFFDAEVFNGYLRVLEYTRAYSSQPPFNLEFIRTALQQIGHFFGDNISLTITVTSALGVEVSLRTYSTDDKIQSGRFARISIFLFFALMLSLVIERKFVPYHYLRLYIPISILASIGLAHFIGFVQKNWISFQPNWKFILTVFCFFALLMSPLPRCMKNTRAGLLYFSSNGNEWVTFQSKNDPARVVEDTKNISTYIRSSPKKGRTFAIATAASYLYRQMDERPFSKFSMPMYYYATVIPKGAYQEMFEEVKQAHWLILQTNDVHPTLYGHTKSSWECVRQDSVMFDYLIANFTKVKEIGAFYIFERND